jgi:hypothetical protein
MNCERCEWKGNALVCAACKAQLDTRLAVSLTDLEPAVQHALAGKKSVCEIHSRCNIKVHSIRTRLADPDGISAKAVIDGLRACGVFLDDSAEFVKEVRFSQEKGKVDSTEITIEWEE